MPVDEGSQKIVLACFLEDPALLDSPFEEEWLYPKDGSHQTFYLALMRMRAEKRPIHAMSVLSYLQDKRILQQSGGNGIVADISGSPTGRTLFAYHVEELKRKHIERSVILGGINLIESAYSHDHELMASTISQEMAKVESAIHAGMHKESWVDQVDAFEEDWNERFSKRKASASSTRWQEWNRHFGGLRPEFHVFKGKTSMGKTSLALNHLATTGVLHGEPCLWFPYEMPVRALISRLICDIGTVESRCVFSPDVFPPNKEECRRIADAKERIRNSPIEIVKETRMDAAFIASRARAFRAKHGRIGLVGIDYLQKIDHPEWLGRNDNSSDRIAFNNDQCFKLQQELGCPLIMISSTNQDGGTLGSQGADYDTDIAVEVDKEKGFRVPKNRNGPTAKDWISLKWNGPFIRFETTNQDNMP